MGWKEIVVFLRDYIELSPVIKYAKRKLVRWEKNYGLPLERELNEKPFIDPAIFLLWKAKVRERLVFKK
jgi:hypothetical protein